MQLHNTHACCDLALSFPPAEVYHKCSQLHIQTWNRWIFNIDINLVIITPESYHVLKLITLFLITEQHADTTVMILK